MWQRCKIDTLWLMLLMGAVTSAASAQQSSETRVQVAVTYAASRSAHTVNVPTFWLQGGAAEVHAPLRYGLGVVAEVTGLHVSGTTQAAPLDMVTVTFGPRYTRPIGRKISVFGQGLLGEADAFHSVFTTGSGPVNSTNGVTSSADSLALQAGGGIDLHLSRRLALRLAEADYLRTQLPNGGTNVQNNMRVAGGVILLLGR